MQLPYVSCTAGVAPIRQGESLNNGTIRGWVDHVRMREVRPLGGSRDPRAAEYENQTACARLYPYSESLSDEALRNDLKAGMNRLACI
jgi:hypothetical protein